MYRKISLATIPAVALSAMLFCSTAADAAAPRKFQSGNFNTVRKFNTAPMNQNLFLAVNKHAPFQNVQPFTTKKPYVAGNAYIAGNAYMNKNAFVPKKAFVGNSAFITNKPFANYNAFPYKKTFVPNSAFLYKKNLHVHSNFYGPWYTGLYNYNMNCFPYCNIYKPYFGCYPYLGCYSWYGGWCGTGGWCF